VHVLGKFGRNRYPLDLVPKLKEVHVMQCSPRTRGVFRETTSKKIKIYNIWFFIIIEPEADEKKSLSTTRFQNMHSDSHRKRMEEDKNLIFVYEAFLHITEET
jgi:hypothetical protein